MNLPLLRAALRMVGSMFTGSQGGVQDTGPGEK